MTGVLMSRDDQDLGRFALRVAGRFAGFAPGKLGLHSALRHFGFCGPEHGVENNPPIVFDRPIAMVMPSGESKSAPTVGPLDGPSNRLLLLLAGDRRVQNGHPAFVAVAETNVVVVFFVELERRQPARDRMMRRSWCRLRL